MLCGSGFKKQLIVIHNISNIKSIYAIGNKDDVEIQIDEEFYNINKEKLHSKIKSIIIPFNVNFITKSLPKELFEFNNELINKVKNSTKEIIDQNRDDDISIEKSYRRKIKKKLVDKQI